MEMILNNEDKIIGSPILLRIGCIFIDIIIIGFVIPGLRVT
ncbi:hypothetical protein [Clostridium fermenticellae]|nr:hypothetical protein [Clostridium fermenticellae]